MRGLCVFLLTVLTRVSSHTDVIGLIGHNVTLPCAYDTKHYGELSFCWGRGHIPRFKCSDTIISSKDLAVQPSQSSRYQLLGRVRDGNISLTILNAQWSDSGVYGCRVEIPGWFNDYKHNTHLVMEEAPVEQPITQGLTLTTETWITFAPMENKEVGDSTLDIVRSGEEKFQAFPEVENIARMGAIFFFTIIISLVFIFRRLFQPRPVAIQHPKISPAENIYESV